MSDEFSFAEFYVREILTQLPDGLTRTAFFDQCEADRNAGWQAEVDEAWRQYSEAGRGKLSSHR